MHCIYETGPQAGIQYYEEIEYLKKFFSKIDKKITVIMEKTGLYIQKRPVFVQ